MNKTLTLILLFLCMTTYSSHAQTLIKGGQFIDRILPMEGKDLRSDLWGAKEVLPRLADNGIEDSIYSYWGGNILQGPDGLYYMNVAGWPENSPRGFNTWSSGSMVYQAVSKHAWGPYKNRCTIGRGHNPETYITRDGKYVTYVIGGRYVASSIHGPWSWGQFVFDKRDREIAAGPDTKVSLSNITFARRPDGSFIAVDRGGGVWVSTDGVGTYHLMTDHTVYQGNRRYFEDPVIWRDTLQYHMIVNDWNARHAFYYRSVDGFHWIQEPGAAYKVGVARHADGTVEGWYKLERPKILQDETGRPAYLNLAVVDTIKAQDRANDNHSSKNIVLPLNRGLLMDVLNTKPVSEHTATVRVMIHGDNMTNAQTDIDVSSLVFGTYAKVDYGKGAKALRAEKSGTRDIIVTFPGAGTGIDGSEWAPKMIGRKKDGTMLFGYARLPYYNYRPPYLSTLAPMADNRGRLVSIVVENWGLSASSPTDIQITDDEGNLLATGRVAPIKPYGRRKVALKPTQAAYLQAKTLKIVLGHEVNIFSVDKVTNRQDSDNMQL